MHKDHGTWHLRTSPSLSIVLSNHFSHAQVWCDQLHMTNNCDVRVCWWAMTACMRHRQHARSARQAHVSLDASMCGAVRWEWWWFVESQWRWSARCRRMCYIEGSPPLPQRFAQPRRGSGRPCARHHDFPCNSRRGRSRPWVAWTRSDGMSCSSS